MTYQQRVVTDILFDFSQENFHSGSRVPSWSLNSSAASSQYLKSKKPKWHYEVILCTTCNENLTLTLSQSFGHMKELDLTIYRLIVTLCDVIIGVLVDHSFHYLTRLGNPWNIITLVIKVKQLQVNLQTSSGTEIHQSKLI